MISVQTWSRSKNKYMEVFSLDRSKDPRLASLPETLRFAKASAAKEVIRQATGMDIPRSKAPPLGTPFVIEQSCKDAKKFVEHMKKEQRCLTGNDLTIWSIEPLEDDRYSVTLRLPVASSPIPPQGEAPPPQPGPFPPLQQQHAGGSAGSSAEHAGKRPMWRGPPRQQLPPPQLSHPFATPAVELSERAIFLSISLSRKHSGGFLSTRSLGTAVDLTYAGYGAVESVDVRQTIGSSWYGRVVFADAADARAAWDVTSPADALKQFVVDHCELNSTASRYNHFAHDREFDGALNVRRERAAAVAPPAAEHSAATAVPVSQPAQELPQLPQPPQPQPQLRPQPQPQHRPPQPPQPQPQPGSRTRFPGPKTLFGAPVVLPVRHTVSSDSDFLSILLEEFDRNAFEIALLPHVALTCKRALACTCYALRERLTPHLRAATLSVRRGDAIWRNALFVARLPGLTDLRVEGETCLPSMDLARYRRLEALKVGLLSPPAALFFGAAIAASNARLRLSDGSTIRNIAALRSSPNPNKAGKEASDADRAALLGALASNQHEPFSALDALSYASVALRADREVVLAAVQQNGLALRYASEELSADRELVLAAVQQDGEALQYASQELKADREIVLAAVQQNGEALRYASEELWADREIVLAAEKQSGRALQYASEELNADREVVLAAVQQSGSALQFASEELKADREIVLAAVQQNGDALRHVASQKLKADREIVLAAVQQSGLALRHVASQKLKADREIVLAAVQQNGDALRHVASQKLKADHEIVLAAVQQNGDALRHVTWHHVADREIVLAAVQQNGDALRHIALVMCSGCSYKLMSADREMVLAAVQQNGLALQYASQELWADREIVLAAVQQNGEALRYASQELKADREIVLAAVQQNGEALRYASQELRSDREIVLAAAQQSRLALQYASEELKADRAFVMHVVQQNGCALQDASPELRSDREIVLAAVQQNGEALRFASEELKADREVMRARAVLDPPSF